MGRTAYRLRCVRDGRRLYASVMRYRDRHHAGAELADALAESLADAADPPLLLGVARGGVPVAAEVARRLGVEFDVAVARKIGAPGNPELGIGAVAADGVAWVAQGRIDAMGVSREFVTAEAERQRSEVQRRLATFRAGRAPVDPAGRLVVVVDDGIATGATVAAVIGWARRSGAAQVWCAVPVAPTHSLRQLEPLVDKVVCPYQPRDFMAVGQWYDDFKQLTDADVSAELAGGTAG